MMTCPRCQNEIRRAKYTMRLEHANGMRRQYQCARCNLEFTTTEAPDAILYVPCPPEVKHRIELDQLKERRRKKRDLMRAQRVNEKQRELLSQPRPGRKPKSK